MNKDHYLMIGGAALAAYLLWKSMSGNTASSPVLNTQGMGAADNTGALQQSIQDAINSSGVSNTYIYSQQPPATWNYFGRKGVPGWEPPAPETLFGNVGNDANKPITFQAWWAKVQPYLTMSEDAAKSVQQSMGCMQ